MNELVSVVVPVYNEEDNINETIESLTNQSYKNMEIILIDDGSTDTSLDICKSYQQEDHRIKIYTQVNKGVSSARNYGIQKSKGMYILFVDSDDILSEEAICEVIEIQRSKKTDIIIYEHKVFSRKKDDEFHKKDKIYQINRYSKDDFFKSKLPYYIESEKLNSLWSKMYKTDIIKTNRIYFDEKLNIAEDVLFNFEYIQNIKDITIYSKPLYYYRVNQENSLTTQFNPNKYEQLMYVNDSMKNLSIENHNNHLLASLNKIRIKNIYSTIQDYLKFSDGKLENKRKIKNIIKEEQKEIKNVKKDFTYYLLQLILHTNNYHLIILTTRLINLIG